MTDVYSYAINAHALQIKSKTQSQKKLTTWDFSHREPFFTCTLTSFNLFSMHPDIF